MAYSLTGPFCDVSGAAKAGIGYKFDLALTNLDEFYPPLYSTSPHIELMACHGSIYMGPTGEIMQWLYTKVLENGVMTHAPIFYGDLPEAQQDAIAEWFDGLPAVWVEAYCFLFIARAAVNLGAVGEEAGAVYKGFGWYVEERNPMGDDIYYPLGDTEWELSGSLYYNNLQCKERITESWSQKFDFRHWSGRSAEYGLFTSANETTTTATIGDATAEATTSYDVQTSPGISVSIHQPWTPRNNTDYALVKNVSSNLGGVPLDLNMNMWCKPYDHESVEPPWVGSATKPPVVGEDPPWRWHFFTTGNTFHLHRIEDTYPGNLHYISTTARAIVYGPVRFNVTAGRGGYINNEEYFPLPEGFLVDAGLRYWTSEAESEPVWLPPGTSRYYTSCIVGDMNNILGTALKTGSYTWTNIKPRIKLSWLEDNDDLLEYQHIVDDKPYGPPVDNSYCYIATPSLIDDPDTTSPYWEDALHYVWGEVSIDVPPDYEERPTLWVAGTDATIDETDNTKWTAEEDGATITRTLATRFDARMGYLETGWDVGKPAYDRDWPIIAKANHQLEADPPEVAAACEVEDVTNYDNSRILCFSFKEDGYPEEVDWSKATLKLTYALYDFRDEWYTPPNHNGCNRFGANGAFEVDTTIQSFTFSGFGTDPPTGALYFDLGELQRSNTVNLRHVRSIELTLPTAGDYELADARLIKDPRDHGGDTYPHWMPQQGVNPWNWVKCGCGWGSTIEGVPHLNIPNGSETYFNGDVQYGIKQLQYWQYNPAWLAEQLEAPEPFDPTNAWNLQRLVAVIGLQEQLTGTYLDVAKVEEATKDENNNSLGFLYFWDLNRINFDCGDQRAALAVGTLESFGITCPLIPLCANIRWSTHGCGQGMAYQKGKFLRGSGGSSDDAGEFTAKIWRRPVDEEGAPVLGEDDEPLPWEECGSFSPGVSGRFTTPPLHEGNWAYKTNTWAGRYVTRQYQYITAFFPAEGEGYPVLAISNHYVANAGLLSDVALAEDESAGHLKIQRGFNELSWSERYPMSDSEDYQWGNIAACTDRIVYAVDDGDNTYIRTALSLDGDYMVPNKIGSSYTKPFVIEAQGRLVMTANKNGNCYFVRLEKEAPYNIVDEVLIGPVGEEGSSTVAYCEINKIFFVAIDTGSGTTIYCNNGDEWFDTGQTVALTYPYLYVDNSNLWLVGYDDGTPDSGAEGQAKAYLYRSAQLLGSPVRSAVVGPSDEGRSAIVQRPVGGQLIVATPKMTEWEEEAPTPAIVEYRSIDSGTSWQREEVHGIE